MTTSLPHGAVATYLTVQFIEPEASENGGPPFCELASPDGAFFLRMPYDALPFLSPNDTLLTTLVMTRITVGEPSDALQ